MTAEWPKVPPDPPAPPPSGLPGQLAAMLALVTAVGGVIGTWRGYEGGQDSTRAAYEALRVRSELQSRQLDELHRSVAEMRDWMARAQARLDERATTAERVLRKVAKPKLAAPLPPDPPPPAPPPPEAPAVKVPAPLPPFDALQ